MVSTFAEQTLFTASPMSARSCERKPVRITQDRNTAVIVQFCHLCVWFNGVHTAFDDFNNPSDFKHQSNVSSVTRPSLAPNSIILFIAKFMALTNLVLGYQYFANEIDCVPVCKNVEIVASCCAPSGLEKTLPANASNCCLHH